MVIDANKWITLFFMAFMFFTGLVVAVVFFIDPFLYYRNVSNDKKLMEPRYSNIGIIKNFRHDMTILGLDSENSMDMLYIRNYHEKRPVQLGIEDSNINDVLILYTISQEKSNSDFYFINVKAEDFIDAIPINLSSDKFPDYLYNNNRLDDIKYLLNYEICFRYIPLNTIIDTAFKLNKSLPIAMKEGTEIDKAAQWKLGILPVKGLAKGSTMHFSINGEQVNTQMQLENPSDDEDIKKKVDSYLEIIFKHVKPNQTIVFGFTPYSVEYWTNVSKMDYDKIMYAKKYFLEQCMNRDNIHVVDMQGINDIGIASNYTSELYLKEDFIKKYTDAIFDETIYEDSWSYEKNKKKLEEQVIQYLKTQ